MRTTLRVSGLAACDATDAARAPTSSITSADHSIVRSLARPRRSKLDGQSPNAEGGVPREACRPHSKCSKCRGTHRRSSRTRGGVQLVAFIFYRGDPTARHRPSPEAPGTCSEDMAWPMTWARTDADSEGAHVQDLHLKGALTKAWGQATARATQRWQARSTPRQPRWGIWLAREPRSSEGRGARARTRRTQTWTGRIGRRPRCAC
jgi:hypothetical protein